MSEIEIKTDADAKALVGRLVYYPGCGLLTVANAKLDGGTLHIAPATGLMFHRVDRPGDLRVLPADGVKVVTPPRPKRRDFSGLLPLVVKFHDGLGCEVQWGSSTKAHASSSAWLGLVLELLTEYAKNYNLCFPKDTEVRVVFAGKVTIVRLDHDVQ